MIEIPKRDIPKNIERVLALFRNGRSEMQRELLNDAQRRDLYQMVQGPGFNVLLDLMERLCVEQETAHVNVPLAAGASESMKEKILYSHAETRAMWLFFCRLQNRIESEINLLLEPRVPKGLTEAEVLDQLEEQL